MVQVAIIVSPAAFSSGSAWPQDWLALAFFVAPASLLRLARRRALPRDPQLDSAPAYVNAIFLPAIFISGVFYDADDVPAVSRDIAEALPLKHLIDGLSGAMVHGEGVGHTRGRARAASGRPPASLAVRGFSWEARNDYQLSPHRRPGRRGRRCSRARA